MVAIWNVFQKLLVHTEMSKNAYIPILPIAGTTTAVQHCPLSCLFWVEWVIASRDKKYVIVFEYLFSLSTLQQEIIVFNFSKTSIFTGQKSHLSRENDVFSNCMCMATCDGMSSHQGCIPTLHPVFQRLMNLGMSADRQLIMETCWPTECKCKCGCKCKCKLLTHYSHTFTGSVSAFIAQTCSIVT